MTGETSYEYNVENEVKFIDSVEITNFSDKESLILTDLDEYRLQSILGQIVGKIVEVNQDKMKELDIEGDNPIIYMIPGLGQSLMLYNSSQDVLNDATNELQKQEEEMKKLQETTKHNNTETDNNEDESQEGESQEDENEEDTNSGDSEGLDDLVDSMGELEMQTFNAKFLIYEGNNTRGVDVKHLLNTIILSNDSNDEDRQIEVTGDIEIVDDEVPDIDTSKNYQVKFGYDREGYINEVQITEQN